MRPDPGEHAAVTGVSPSTVAIAWPEHADSQALRVLLRAARNVAESALANGAGAY